MCSTLIRTEENFLYRHLKKTGACRSGSRILCRKLRDVDPLNDFDKNVQNRLQEIEKILVYEIRGRRYLSNFPMGAAISVLFSKTEASGGSI